jgi:hypothetical protein
VGYSNYAVGYNNVKVPEATKRGIPVGNTPGWYPMSPVRSLLGVQHVLEPYASMCVSIEGHCWCCVMNRSIGAMAQAGGVVTHAEGGGDCNCVVGWVTLLRIYSAQCVTTAALGMA